MPPLTKSHPYSPIHRITGWFDSLRQSGANPDEVIENLAPLAWWDSSDSGTLFADTGGTSPASLGGVIGRWADKTGNNNNVTQSTPQNRPTFSVDGVSFDGTDFLREASADILDLGTNDITVFCVVNPGGNSETTVFSKAALNAGVADGRYLLYFAFGATLCLYQNNSTDYQAFNFDGIPTVPTLVTYRLNRSAGIFRLYKNGVQAGNNDIPAESVNHDVTYPFLIGAARNSTDTGQINFFNGTMQEIIYFDSNLSDTDRQAVDNYLITKWSLA